MFTFYGEVRYGSFIEFMEQMRISDHFIELR